MAEKRIEWMGVTVYRKDWQSGGTSYRAQISGHPWNAEQRCAEDRWISIWHTLRFPQGTEIPDRAVLNIRGNERPTERINRQTGMAEIYPTVWVSEYEIVGQQNPPQTAPQNAPQGFNQQNQGFGQQAQNNAQTGGQGFSQGFQQNTQQNNGFGQGNPVTFDEIDTDIPF